MGEKPSILGHSQQSGLGSIELTELEQIGPLIRALRRSQKISRDELASFSGLHRNGIARLESPGKDVKLSTLLRIFSLLGIRLVLECDPPL